MTRLKANDQVIVIAGAGRGKTGRILSIDRKHDKVVVEGVNLKYKHMKRSQQSPQGGRVQREFPVHVSNVAFLDAGSGKGVRLGSLVADGRKHRVARPSGQRIEEKKR